MKIAIQTNLKKSYKLKYVSSNVPDIYSFVTNFLSYG